MQLIFKTVVTLTSTDVYHMIHNITGPITWQKTYLRQQIRNLMAYLVQDTFAYLKKVNIHGFKTPRVWIFIAYDTNLSPDYEYSWFMIQI